MQLRHCVVTEWNCCLIFQRWTFRDMLVQLSISHMVYSILASRLTCFQSQSLSSHFFNLLLKNGCSAHWGVAVISRDGSADMTYTRPGKCRYVIPSHTVPLRARITAPRLLLQPSLVTCLRQLMIIWYVHWSFLIWVPHIRHCGSFDPARYSS